MLIIHHTNTQDTAKANKNNNNNNKISTPPDFNQNRASDTFYDFELMYTSFTLSGT